MPQKNHLQKGSATIIAFILFLLALGGTVWYFKSFPKDNVLVGEPITQPQVVETKNQVANNPPTIQPAQSAKSTTTKTTTTGKWKVFQSSRYTFQFNYPAKWSVEDALDSDGAGLILKNENGSDIVYINTGVNTSVIGISYCGAHPKDARCEALKTNNGSTVTIEWGLSGMSNAMLTSQDGTHGVIFSVEEPDADTKNIFRKIFSTFKFVK